MTYREPAPKEPLPVERFSLASSNSFVWYLMIVVMVGAIVLGFMSSVHLECVRPLAGEPARCTGASFNILMHPSHELTPFTLEQNAIQVGRSAPNRKGRTFTAIVTPSGLMSGFAVDRPFALRVVEEAERFREDPKALEWHAARATWSTAVYAFLFGCALVGLKLLYRRWDVLELDPNLRRVKVRRKSWSLDDMTEVDTDRSRGDSTLKVTMGGKEVDIAWGNRKAVEAAEKAIRREIEART